MDVSRNFLLFFHLKKFYRERSIIVNLKFVWKIAKIISNIYYEEKVEIVKNVVHQKNSEMIFFSF